MVYTPKYYRETRREVLHPFIQENNFATLIVSKENEARVSHLPFLFAPERGEEGVLVAHMAKANPQWRAFQSATEVLVVFQGPHAYISPQWYELQPDDVPTWNYAVVHAYGAPKIVTGEEEAYDAVRRMVALHDPEWTLELSSKARKELMAQIVVFEIHVSKLEASFKLGQNRSQRDQANIAEHLAKSPRSEERAVAEWMKSLNALHSRG